jgi:hypothetical protein
MCYYLILVACYQLWLLKAGLTRRRVASFATDPTRRAALALVP